MGNDQKVSCFTALGSLALIAVLVAFALHYPKEPGDWAAWVQAIGSIAAILGAVYSVREGARVNARLKDEQFKRSVLAVTDAYFEKVEAIVQAIQLPGDFVQFPFHERYAPSSMDGFLRALNEVPVLELPTPAAISAMLSLQRFARFFTLAADELHTGPWSPNNSLHDQLLERRDVCDQNQELFGGVDYQTIKAKADLYDMVKRAVNVQKRYAIDMADTIRAQRDILRAELGGSKLS